jgi:GST-like protein
MLTLFSAASVNGQRATIGLLESGLPHRLVAVDLKRRPAALRRISRYGRVPTLLDSAPADGRPLVLEQSGAILLYLAEKCGHLLPAAPRARAECHRWLLMHANDLGPAFIASYTVTRLGQPQELAAADFRARVLRFCGMLDDRLAEARFLAGDGFSIADCAVYPDVPWCFKDFPGVERLGHLRRWMEELAARPALAQAMAWAQLQTA